MLKLSEWLTSTFPYIVGGGRITNEMPNDMIHAVLVCYKMILSDEHLLGSLVYLADV